MRAASRAIHKMEDVAKDPAMAAAFADRSSSAASEPSRLAARAALRDRLARVKDFPGVTGNITIDRDRNAQKPAVVVRVTKEGPKFVAKILPGGAEPAAAPVAAVPSEPAVVPAAPAAAKPGVPGVPGTP